MIVLDQHRVVEAEAMVGAAARAHRVFLERAQDRRRLARADDARLRMRATAATSRAVALAMPLSRLTKLSATRSADSMPRAGPSIVATIVAGRDARAVGHDPTVTPIAGSMRRKASAASVEAGDDAGLARRHDAS